MQRMTRSSVPAAFRGRRRKAAGCSIWRSRKMAAIAAFPTAAGKAGPRSAPRSFSQARLCETCKSGEATPVTDEDITAACRRALGFLELGMPEDALAELDELKVAKSIALRLRVDVLFRLGNWAAAAAICLPMTEQEPSDPGWWIQAA